jgi:hypothetical protein
MKLLPLWKTFHNGKTFLAKALAHEACTRGFSAIFPVPGKCLKIFIQVRLIIHSIRR